jgi:hypothetical protein
MGKLSYSFEKQFFDNEFNKILKASISRMDYKVDFFYKKEKEIFSKDEIIKMRKGVKNEEYFGNAEEIIESKKTMPSFHNNLHIERYFLKGKIQT